MMSARQAPWRRILLTGGTGFVGGYLAPAIVAAYPDAKRLLLRRPGDTVVREGWQAVDGEIYDPAALTRIVGDFRPDLILHLAGQASVGSAMNAPAQTWKVNYEGTVALATSCSTFEITPTFVFVSSSEVYGESFRAGMADEMTALRPTNAYADSKAAAEDGLATALPLGSRLIILRPFNHTGPGQDQRFVLPSFAFQVAEIEAGVRPPRLEVGNIEAVRDFLDVRDVCDAYLAVLSIATELPTLDATRRVESVFNIASGTPRRIGDLIDILGECAATPFEVIIDPSRLRTSDIPIVTGSSARIENLTGWRRKIPIERTLEELLDYCRRVRRAP
jgi:GDP-4-dehydro-6-deoxy-D-mannose reductase